MNPVVSANVDFSVEEVKVELRSKFEVVMQFIGTDKGELLFDISKYSKLSSVLRVTAWIQRFLNNRRSSLKKHRDLSAEELVTAEVYWIRMTQKETFGREMNLLREGQCVHKDSKIKELQPFLDEHGLISVGGRLQQSDLTFRE